MSKDQLENKEPQTGRRLKEDGNIVNIADGYYVDSDGNTVLRTSATISGDVNVDSSSVDTSGLIGKTSGGDFTTAYASATTIDLTNLPENHATFIAEDIVAIVQIATDGSVTNTYTRDDKTMTVTTNTITVVGATFLNTDTFVVYTNINRESDVIVLPHVTQYSPTHFNSVYTSNVTITLSGVNFTATDVQVKYVIVNPASPATAIYIDGVNGVSLTIASNVVTITGAGTPLVNTDTYEVGLLTKNIGDDIDLDLKKTGEQAPINGKQTDPEAYTTLTPVDVAYDKGAVISTYGYNSLNYAFSKTASDADDSYIKVSYLNATGTVDYQETVLVVTTAGITSITPHVYQVDKAALVNIVSFPTKGYPYMRIDIAKVTDNGTDAVFTGEVNKSYL